jgi:hypothetical protein
MNEASSAPHNIKFERRPKPRNGTSEGDEYLLRNENVVGKGLAGFMWTFCTVG